MFGPDKKIMRGCFYSLLVLVPAAYGLFIYSSLWWKKTPSIKVGILYSTTGSSAKLEQPIVDTLLLAIEEINAQGGVLGAMLEPIIADAMSQENVYAREAQRLITKNDVAVIFGCLDSSSRKSVKPIVEKSDKMLVFAAVYEGLEYSPNIMYTGMIPNQFVLPGVAWAFENLGKTFYLMGTSSLFSVVINEIVKIYVNTIGGTIVGESYIPIDSLDLASAIQEIKDKNPAVVINTLEVASSSSFFKLLLDLNIEKSKVNIKDKIACMALNLYEDEIGQIGVKNLAGHYAAWSYYSGIDSAKNYEFKAKLHKRFGSKKLINNLDELAYVSVYLWSKAVQIAGSVKSKLVKKALSEISYNAPSGLVYFDSVTNHIWRPTCIGRFSDSGFFNVVWNSGKPLEPSIYPLKPQAEWEVFLKKILG